MATPVQDDVPILPEGMYGAPSKAEPSRTTLGAIRDLAIDAGTSAIDVLATPYTAARDTMQDPKLQAAAQMGQNVANAAKDWLRSGKTEKGQWEDETGAEKSWAREAAEMPIASAPALATAAYTGPLAPVTYAAIAVGQQGLETEKKIQDYSEKELMEASEPYARYRTEGMTDQEARRRLYHDMQNLETTAPTAIANILPAAGFTRMMGRMGSKTIAQTMTQRIMQNVPKSLAEGAGGGFALGAGQSYGRQAADVAGGFQDKIHYGEAVLQGASTARTLGVVSGVGSLAGSIRGPKGPAKVVTGGDLLKEADKKVPAPPVGAELTDVAKDNLAPKPPGEERAGPGPADTEAKPPTPPAPPEAKPPVEEPATPPMDVTPPGIPVEPKLPVEEPAAAPPAPTSDIRFRDADTIKARIDDLQASIKDLETQPLAEKVKPEWKEQHDQFTEEFHRLQDEHEQLTGAAVPHTPPSDEAVKAHLDITAPPEAKGLTWDQLGERAGDLEQTPTMDALNAHVKEWKEANPKTKVPDYGSLVKKWTAAKKEAKDAADAARDAQKKADLEAKKTQRAKDTEVRKAVKEDTVAREGQASTDKKVEALRQEFLEHEKKATADDLTNPEWQAKSDSLYGAWKDAEVAGRPENKQAPVKAVVEGKKPVEAKPVEKPKPVETKVEPEPTVTPPGKPKPSFEDVAALIEPRRPKVKPGETPPEKPGEKPVEKPTEPEKKPGTLTLKKRTEVEGDEAAKAEAKALQEKLKKEKIEDDAKKRKDAERKAVKRKADQETREQAAQKIILEQKGRHHNRQAHLDELERHMIDSKPDDAVPHMLEIAEGAHDLASNYEAELARLREGKATHDTFMMGRGKTGESRATTLGDHHSVLSDVRNYARTIQELIAKKHFLEAKDMTDRYVRMMKAVHNGEIEEVTRLRREMNDAVEMAKKTNKGGEEQIEAATVEKATEKQHDIISAIDEKLDEEVDKSGPPSVRPGVRQPLIMKDAHGNDVLNKDGTPKLLLDKNGRMQWAPDADRALLGQVYVNGIEHKGDIGQRRMIKDAADYEARRLGVRELTPDQYADMLTRAGGRVGETTFGKLMDDPKMRPKDPVRGMLYDVVRKITGDMPVKIWSRDEMDAYTDHVKADTQYGWRAFYNTEMASAYFRPDTLVPNTIFHEALHAASMRAINRSARLRALVDLIQSVVVRTMVTSPTQRETMAYRVAIEHVNHKGELVRVDPHEFTSELYSRPEVSDLIKKMKLTPKELQEFASHGYKVDMGKGLLRTWWDGLLRALNFQPARPNLYKVSIDVLGDTFDREMQHRYEDRYSGLDTHPDFRVGADYDVGHSWRSSFKEDPVPGSPFWAAREAMLRGNHPEAVRLLTEAAPRMSEKMLDGIIDYMSKVNDKYWGEDSLHNRFAPEEVTPLSTPEGIRSDFVDRIEKRFGVKAADRAWQAQRMASAVLGRGGGSTAIRHIMSGLKYTNDIGRNLEPMFQKVLQPLKDAWASREHFATKYMDTSGANKLIDDIATMKNAFKDRHKPESVWNQFQKLIINEGYSRTRADEELGTGANQHINTGDLRDRQSVNDWYKNREIYERLRKDAPELIALRNRIFDFTKKELEQRHRAAARDALLSMGIVKHGDEVGLSALTKDIRRENHLMTAEERAAYDRILKVGKGSDEYKRLMIDREAAKKAHGEGSKLYSDHLAKSVKKETELLVNPKGEEYEKYKKNRDDVRTIIDHEKISGPHAPFMRHGKHAVYAEFQVTPDAGVAYNEVHPEADTHTMYDFKNRTDAEHFIDNTLSHPDININLRNAYDVIYDTKTGDRAAHWTIEKPDGTAKTYDSLDDANAAKGEKDKITKKFTTAEDIKQMKDSGISTDHLETRSRVVFNPKEFTKFESERAANEHRDKLNQDTGNPNFRTKVAQVETPDSEIGRANVAYTSAEMKNWIKRKEQSPEYQRMDPDEKAEWARRMRVEAQRVTAMAGRRTAHMPREYARGASDDILKNMIDYSGSNARAMADLIHRSAIDKGLQDAEAYNDKYKYQSGGISGDHRVRDDAMREIKARLFAPPRVEDSWAIGVKRALQVSTISHLADTGYLIVNALEPWVFGAAISASRHGWGNTYGELADATRMVDVKSLGLMAGSEMKAAWQGKFGGTNHEQLLLDRVNSNANIRGDARGASLMLQHMFNKGLAARDVGVEAERVHDPSKNAVFRALDKVDAFFRASNAAVETLNRGILAISNYRLEYKRALKDLGIKFDAEAIRKGEATLPWHEGAHEQAMRYAEDQVFKGAGDYSAWNNPRYMRNPALKMAMQFKKYPLRIASVYFDAIARSVKGDREAQIQLAYMTIAQSVAAGAMGTPWASPAAGLVNAAYLMGITDSNWNDVEFGIRKAMAPIIGVTATDTFLHGLFRFSGADFSSKMAQNSFVFFGSPESRNGGDLMKTLALVAAGAPGDVGKKFYDGVMKIEGAIGDINAGATSQGMAKGVDGLAGIMQIKQIMDLLKAGNMMLGGPQGLPKGSEASTYDAFVTGMGFSPTGIAKQLEEKRVITRAKKVESADHNKWVNRWRDAPDSEKGAVRREIDKYNASLPDQRLKITAEDLWKAKTRQKNDASRDSTKTGVRLSGRQKAFADLGGYFDTGR